MRYEIVRGICDLLRVDQAAGLLGLGALNVGLFICG